MSEEFQMKGLLISISLVFLFVLIFVLILFTYSLAYSKGFSDGIEQCFEKESNKIEEIKVPQEVDEIPCESTDDEIVTCEASYD